MILKPATFFPGMRILVVGQHGRGVGKKLFFPVDDYQENGNDIIKRFPDKNEREFFYNEISLNFNKAEYAGWDYQAALTLWKMRT
ncbi:MAG: hypothetical protein IPG53_20480 [Ignavibacteriales bacterium]|nr:hypothetical protein [Ignavibacteriales bacterium]